MNQIPLGQATSYPTAYAPDLLFPVARQLKRDELGISQLPFAGTDCWTAYELSWLNRKGKPMVAIGEILFDATSPNLIESKSLKLYLNSLNQHRFESTEQLIELVRDDLSKACGARVGMRLVEPKDFAAFAVSPLPGHCIDDLDIEISSYQYDPALLQNESAQPVEEILVSHLLKSNCLITSQPDWASLQIHYQGPKIEQASLLRYLISFRSHNEFHEQCVERIFCDLKRFCRPQKLSVYARYTRRGGLDINPFRSDFDSFSQDYDWQDNSQF